MIVGTNIVKIIGTEKNKLLTNNKMEQTKIFASIIDDVTKKQIETLGTSEAYKDSVIRVMPDCHAGKGCTIGSVIKYSDRVVPNTVGVDIGCGMLVTELGNIDVDLQRLDAVINTFIPSGFAIHEKPIAEYHERWNAPIPDNKEKYIQCSIGSLGGGNHFIELNEDNEGNKYLVIHSGSRNLGVLICNYYQELAISKLTDDSQLKKEMITLLKAEGREKEINDVLKALKKPKIDRELAYLEDYALNEYIADMKNCQEYASLNRETMASVICKEMGWYPLSKFETIHNYIDIPNKIIRKGAVRAEKNEMLIIPMNMRDGSLICRGKGNEDWLNSAPHGAGRIMSRTQAKDTLKLSDFQESMKDIYTTSVCEETIDEAPMVYKDAKQIMEDVVPTVDIIKVIKPIYNFKAKTPEKAW